MFVMDYYGHKLFNGVLFAHHLILDVPGGSPHLGYRRRVPLWHNPPTRVKHTKQARPARGQPVELNDEYGSHVRGLRVYQVKGVFSAPSKGLRDSTLAPSERKTKRTRTTTEGGASKAKVIPHPTHFPSFLSHM